MSIGTKNLDTSQYIGVVIIKKEENVEFCFDVTTTLNTQSTSFEDQATKWKSRLKNQEKYWSVKHFGKDFGNQIHGMQAKKYGVQPLADFWSVVQ